MRWYSFIPENSDTCKMIYQRKCPPNNSVYECWTTVGVENDGAQITFVEYDYYDKDPDGVREAYDCMYDSEYNITVDITKSDNKKIFAYTVTKDEELILGYDIDITKTRAIYLFTEQLNLDDDLLINLTSQIEADKQNAEEIIRTNLFSVKNTPCLVIFNDRM